MTFVDEAVEAPHISEDRTPCDICGKGILAKHMARHKRNMHGLKADRPPGGGARTSTGRAKSSGGRRKSLRAELEVTYGMAAQFWAMRDPFCGQTAMAQVPQIAEAWDTWAQSNAQVHRIITMMTSGSGPLMVLTAHLPIAVAIASHHNPQARAAEADARAQAEAAANEAAFAAQMAGANANASPNNGYVPDPQVASDYAGTVYEPGSADRAR